MEDIKNPNWNGKPTEAELLKLSSLAEMTDDWKGDWIRQAVVKALQDEWEKID